jgi:predicted nucleotide-binding protein
MIDRFRGDAGKKNLIDALLQQRILTGDRAIAEKIASMGELVQFDPGATIVEQGGSDDTVFFIINGKTDVFVNHQHVATREGGTVVGEMVAVDPAARRSATLKAANIVTTLKVSGDHFRAAADSSPQFWRYVAQLVADRLRERSKFHLPANPTPIMFVGSSVEGLKVAEEIAAGLKHDEVIVRLWTTNGVFGPSRLPVEDLMAQVEIADFALFVFGPDDKISSRADDYMVPRDNVIFEMGLFVGRLGRDRVFMVKDADVDIKIPSDLSGVNPITYKCKPGCDLADVVGTVCTDLRKVISAKGVVANRMKV